MESVNWYTWQTEADFDTWHNQVVAALNLPQVGVNQATGKPQPSKTKTLAYTTVVQVADGDWRADVEKNIATQFPDGLGTLSEAPPLPEVDL